MPEATKLTKIDVDTIHAKMDIDRQMIYLKVERHDVPEIPELGIFIGQAHMLITHLKKMVEAYEMLRPYASYAGIQIVDESD